MVIRVIVLTVDIVTTLPPDTLIEIRISLKIRSNTIHFVDEDSNVIMDICHSGVSLIKGLDMPYNSVVSVINITATGTIATTGAISSNSLTTNTLTLSGASINIKSDLLLFKGFDKSIYMGAHLGGLLFL